jgi:hypothetical protein
MHPSRGLHFNVRSWACLSTLQGVDPLWPVGLSLTSNKRRCRIITVVNDPRHYIWHTVHDPWHMSYHSGERPTTLHMEHRAQSLARVMNDHLRALLQFVHCLSSRDWSSNPPSPPPRPHTHYLHNLQWVLSSCALFRFWSQVNVVFFTMSKNNSSNKRSWREGTSGSSQSLPHDNRPLARCERWLAPTRGAT